MHRKTFDLDGQSVKIETGLLAKQATASVTVDIDGTVILATLVADKNDSDRDFFHLLLIILKRPMLLEKFLEGFSKEKEGQAKKKHC